MLGNFKKITVSVGSEGELLDILEKAQQAKLDVHLCVDSGLTEFNGVPTKTCLAIGPDYSDVIDQITGALKLL
jgi:PTH2 family peptidyl-tRNA hydrolase